MTTPAPEPQRTGAVVAVLAAGGIVAALMQTLVVPLIAELPKLLHTTSADASWVVTATLLAGAVATPVTGRLGDLYGKRRLMLICVGLLVVGSLVCAPADSLAPMVIGRALQGASMGIIPLGISVMRDVLPPERVGSSIALMSASLGIGGALGLPIAAAVAQNSDWHMLFWGAAVLSALLAALIRYVVPTAPVSAAGRFDFVGAAGLAVGLVALLLGVSKGGDWGWGGGSTLGCFAVAVVVLLAWGAWELRVGDPLVDLRTTALRQVLLTNVASVVVGFAMYAQSLVAPQLLQLPESTGYGLGQTMFVAGMWMAPAGLVMMAVSPLGARLSAARGPKVSLLAGSLIIAFGYGLAVVLMGSVWGLVTFSCVISVGVAFAYGAMPALIMSAVPLDQTAAANGFNSLARSVGTAVSSAVMGVVLAQLTVTSGGYTLPSETGFRTTFVIGGAVAVVAAIIVVGIPGRNRGKNRPGTPAEPAVTGTAAPGLAENAR